MFWLQISLSFLIWIASGIVLARRPNPVAGLVQNMPRVVRILSAAGLMACCLALLFLPLNFIAAHGGLNGGPMSIPVWVGVTTTGTIFVLANAISMAILVGVAREAAVTERAYAASTNQDPEP